VLCHRDAGVRDAVVPAAGEEVDGSGGIDATLRTDHAAILRVRRRVDDDPVPGRAVLHVIQGDAVAGGPQVQEVDPRVLRLDQPRLVHALHRRQVLHARQDLLYRDHAGYHPRQRTPEGDLAAGTAQSTLLQLR